MPEQPSNNDSSSSSRPVSHEPKCLESVAEFHDTFQCPVLTTPQIPDAKRCQLRVNLIQEELNELKEAIATNDLVEVADALADIQYVLSGTVHEFGLGPRFKALFDEVHRSNMSKACETENEAEQTVQHYKKKDGTEAHYKEVNGKYNVYRNTDNKTLKSVNYSPADLQSIVERPTATTVHKADFAAGPLGNSSFVSTGAL